MRVIRCELLVHPSKVENAVNLADQMIAWHYLESSFASRLNGSFATQSRAERT